MTLNLECTILKHRTARKRVGKIILKFLLIHIVLFSSIYYTDKHLLIFGIENAYIDLSE